LGDRVGRRLIFAAGVGLFTLASVGCGLAANVNLLIAARAVQGIGGALLVPGSLAIISAFFAASQRGKAIGTWSSFTAMTSAIGPVLGGWLVETASWRWIFFINVPLGLLVLGILFWQVPESRDSRANQLDWGGAVLATVGLGSLVFGLIEASNLGLTHPLVLAAVSLGLVGLVGFLVVESRHRAPMMPLTLFRSRTFSGTNLLTLLLYGALGGVLYFVPFNLIQVQGYSATAAGAAFLPLILLIFLLSRWSGGLVSRYGAKRPLIIGPAIAAIGFLLLARPGIGGSYWTTFFPAIVILGLGMAISVAPLTTTVMGAVDVQYAGIASGINNAVARTAALLAVACFNLVMLAAFNARLNYQLTRLNLPADAWRALETQRNKLAGIDIPATLPSGVQADLAQAIDQAFVSGFRLVMLIAVVLALASALLARLMIQPTRLSPS
jgi:EmrB/QacA subfamily drug resistance transporter